MHPILPDDYLQRLPDLKKYLEKIKPQIKDEIINADVKPLLFIAGPYTLPYPVYNTHRAMAWYDLLAESQVVVPHCPHLTMFQDLMFPKPYETWLALDRQMVRKSDALIRLSGESTGADGEELLSIELNKSIFYEENFENLFPWAINWIKVNN